MKKWKVERTMRTNQDGHYKVVEDATHLNKDKIHAAIFGFTHQGGYDYNHPEGRAKQYAEAVCKALNEVEQIRQERQASKVRKQGSRLTILNDEAVYRVKETPDEILDTLNAIEPLQSRMIQLTAVNDFTFWLNGDYILNILPSKYVETSS